MSEQDWDPMQWQGRRKSQVESNNNISILAVGGIVLVLLFDVLVEVFKMLFSSF